MAGRFTPCTAVWKASPMMANSTSCSASLPILAQSVWGTGWTAGLGAGCALIAAEFNLHGMADALRGELIARVLRGMTLPAGSAPPEPDAQFAPPVQPTVSAAEAVQPGEV